MTLHVRFKLGTFLSRFCAKQQRKMTKFWVFHRNGEFLKFLRKTAFKFKESLDLNAVFTYSAEDSSDIDRQTKWN